MSGKEEVGSQSIALPASQGACLLSNPMCLVWAEKQLRAWGMGWDRMGWEQGCVGAGAAEQPGRAQL